MNHINNETEIQILHTVWLRILEDLLFLTNRCFFTYAYHKIMGHI